MQFSMKRYLVLIIAFLFLNTTKASSLQSANIENSHTLLWEISHPEIHSPSYLFGTIHIICEEYFVWTPTMQEKLNACKNLTLEIDLTDTMKMMEAMTLLYQPHQQSLSSYFHSMDTFQKLKQFVENKLKLDSVQIEKMQPIALYLMLSNSAANSLCNTTLSYEISLIQLATEQQLKIQGLESFTDQIEALNSLSKDTIIHEMLKYVNHKNEEETKLIDLMQAYYVQNLPLIQHLLQEENHAGIYEDELIHKRNAKWIPIMEQSINKAPTFFAVGAGHLQGLIELLRQKGYTIKPVL
jgi:uncharacterized protein YbaP (TraB family)